MKLTFVIPSRDFLTSAGARIRYLRMVHLVRKSGHEIDLVPIGEFQPVENPGEFVIFSKCFDARAIVAASQCRADGRIVGVDLFDDYFSQASNSRMIVYRTWLDQMLCHSHFALCSTTHMAAIVAAARSDLPTHVFNDPAIELRAETLPALLATKLNRTRTERRVRLCWFGIGDNPFFPVGLEDLAAFGARLAVLQDGGWEVDLTVLTNARALDADRLSGLARLPFPVAVELWSAERETQLLLDSFCCFLPVNAQPFSVAKSLNRAVSALTAGCQVIWAGYPLYRHFDALVYADPESLARDLEDGSVRLGPERLDIYLRLMNEFASLENEVERMIAFLEELRVTCSNQPALGKRQGSPGGPELTRVLVHGAQTNGDAHKAARKHGMLSVGSPFSTPSLVYDVLFTGRVVGGDLRMLVADPIMSRLPPAIRRAAMPFGKINKVTYHALDWPEGESMNLHNWSQAELPDMLAAYTGIFPELKRRLEAVFGQVEMVISESSKLPFDPAIGSVAA